MSNNFMKVSRVLLLCKNDYKWMKKGDFASFQKVWDKYVIFSTRENEKNIILSREEMDKNFELTWVDN